MGKMRSPCAFLEACHVTEGHQVPGEITRRPTLRKYKTLRRSKPSRMESRKTFEQKGSKQLLAPHKKEGA